MLIDKEHTIVLWDLWGSLEMRSCPRMVHMAVALGEAGEEARTNFVGKMFAPEGMRILQDPN